MRAVPLRSFLNLSSTLLLIALFFPGGRSAYAAWQLVWNDEFEGTNLDATRWTFDIGNGAGGWGNNELEYYTSRTTNVYVADGLLHIVARKESYKGFGYTSARLKTLGLFSKLYGRFEFRVKLPQGKGYWPALWLMPRDSVYGGWAASGEVDIMENKGRIPTQVLGTLHFGGSWPNQDQSYGPAYSFSGGDSVTNFHVYAMEWSTNQFKWYVDGRLYQTQSSWYSTGGAYPAPFDRAFYILMNLAVGGNFDGNPDTSTVFPGEMQIDYVRVYDWAASPAAGLKLHFDFEDPPGSTASASQTGDGGADVTLQMMDGRGTPFDLHGDTGSGVAGSINGGRALDFSSNDGNQPGIPGPVGGTTNANLGFGAVSNFVVSLWFKQDALMAAGANIGPRLFVLGGGAPSDTDAPHTIGLKFQTAGQLYFQMNGLTVPFGINLQTNTWVFVAAVYDGNSVSIYQGTDGAVASLCTNVAVATTLDFGINGALFLGNRQDRQCSFDGRIDDFRFYSGVGDGAFVEDVRLLAARPPWGLTAVAGSNQVTLNWGAALGATGYNVKRAAAAGGPYTTLQAGGQVAETSFTDSTASNGMTYYYVVASVNPAGEGTPSSEASATPAASAPSMLLFAHTLGAYLVLNWSDGTLQWGPEVLGPWQDVAGAVSPYTNLMSEQQRFFRLR